MATSMEKTESGKNFFKLGDYNTAENLFTQAIQLDSSNALAYYWRGHIYSEFEEYKRAIADYIKATELLPLYQSRADSYLEVYDWVISDCTRAIELDSNSASAYCVRGRVYLILEKYNRAIVDLNRAIELDPNFALAYNNRGVAYKNSGQYERAIADYTKAIELDPNYAMAYKNRGNAYKELGETEKAEADFAKAKELKEN